MDSALCSHHAPQRVCRARAQVLPLCASAKAVGMLCAATRRTFAFYTKIEMPNFAPQLRTALSSIVANTGSRSPGELAMTCSTSDVAVCRSSAPVSLRSQFIEQPRVLDGDDGLGGEILD